MPYGAHVYAAGRNDNAVAVFSRNLATGALTFVEAKVDGVGGVTDLRQTTGVAVSSDGAHVYATGLLGDAVVAFGRNAGTGALSFLDSFTNGSGGIAGLIGPTALALSPDGAHVYVAGEGDDAVAAFVRNGGTGALTFVEAERDGVGSVDGIARATTLAVSPDGANVYVAGEHDNAVATFSRNVGTGALSFVEFDKGNGLSGLKGPQSIVVAPDGAAVYVACEFQRAIAFLLRNAMTGA